MTCKKEKEKDEGKSLVFEDDLDRALLADEDFLDAIAAGLEAMGEEEEKEEEDALLKKYGF